MRMLIACGLLVLCSATAAAEEAGTTIVGESESAIGLNLMPWKNESRADMDLAPALLNEMPEVVDPETFRSRVETYDAIGAHRRARSKR